MDTLAARMQWLRLQWGMSNRALSMSLGLNAASWNVYEQGTSQPGAQVLTLLAEKNVNINWLLTGIGNPWIQQGGTLLQSTLRQLESEEAQRLKITDLKMKAKPSNLALRYRILETMSGVAPKRLSFVELANLLGDESKTDLLACIAGLLESSTLEATEESGESERYKLKSAVVSNNPETEAELAALILDGIQFLATDIRTGCQTAPKNHILLTANLATENGQRIVDIFKTTLCNSTPGDEKMKVLLAARIG